MKALLSSILFVLGFALPVLGSTVNPVSGTKSALVADETKLPEGLSGGDWASIKQAYQAQRHAIVSNGDGTHQARNPGQAWLTRFDDRGFTVKPDAAGWEWGLELASYGYAGQEVEVAGGKAAVAGDGKLVRSLDGNIQEWFVNDARGLEQGWTLAERPVHQGDGAGLVLNLRTRGGLAPVLAEGGASVSFADPDGTAVLTYSGLKAWDANGRSLTVTFAHSNDHGGLVVQLDDAKASYPVTIDPVAQQAYLKASNTGINDCFGYSVAVSGDTVVVGARGEASAAIGVNGDQADNSATASGAVYVFVRSGTNWSQQAYLKASNTEAGDMFGHSVALSGDTVVVGAFFEDSSATSVNGNGADNSAVDSGAAYVFVRSGTNWSQQAYLKASNTGAGDRFGCSVSVSSDTVVVGAVEEASAATGVNTYQGDDFATSSGAAYVFVRDSTSWSQQAYLKASNTEKSDGFGQSVAVSGDTVVVGACGEDSAAIGVNGNGANNSAEGSGAAYVFVRTGTTWSQQAYLKASNTEAGDSFGCSVAVSDDTVVVGAYYEASAATGVNGNGADNSATSSGAAYVFVRTGTTWSQQAYLKASNTGADDWFGFSVAVSGDTVVVGAFFEDSAATGVNGDQADNSATNSGAAYVFVRSDTSWSQQAYLKASNTGTNDNFGTSVAVSGDSVMIGAYYEASAATGVNGNGADNSATSSGAAYVFDLGGLVFNYTSAQDLPVVSSNYTAVGSADLSLDFAPPTGADLMVVKNTGIGFINGRFDNLAQGQVVNLSYDGVSYKFVANYYGGTGNDLVLQWAWRNLAAWGENSNRQLGDGTATTRSTPVLVNQSGVLAGKTVVAVAGAYHSLALCSDGTVAAWGNNSAGKLGDGTTTDRSTPVLVNQSGVLAGKTVVAIAAGFWHSLALCSDGKVAAWGDNYYSQLGDGSTTGRSTPVLVNQSGVLAGKTVVAVAAGGYHSLALCSDGTVAAWGDNDFRQLGDGTTTDRLTPVMVKQTGVLAGRTVAAVAAGIHHSLALCSDGTVAAWGRNDRGQLGDGTGTDRSTPVLVNQSGVLAGKTVVAVEAGENHSLALCSDGTVAAWGGNYYGQLGDGTMWGCPTPVLVNQSGVLAGRTVVAVEAGYSHNLALCSDGTVAAWGYNSYGQFGDGTTAWSSTPVLVNQSGVLAGGTVMAAEAGACHSLAIAATRNLSDLSNLWLSTGTLSPAFASGTTSYTANVASTTASMTVTPTVTDATATVKVNGITVASGAASQSIPLVVGPNTITVLVTAQDGVTTTTYTVTVTRAPSTACTLSGLTPSAGALSPEFGSETTSYTVNVASTTASMTVTATVTDSTAKMKVNGSTVVSGAASQSIPLVVGTNTITVLVTAEDGVTTTTYTVTVTRAPSTVCTLAGLSVSTGTLSPAFASGTIYYTANVPNSTASMTVTPMVTNSTATTKVNGSTVVSGAASQSIPLVVGPNTITVLVTAQDGVTTTTYTVTVTRAPSTACTLSGLTPSAGALSPEFGSETTSYTVNVASTTASMTVTATVTDSTAKMKVNGSTVVSGAASQSIPLVVGTNTITVLVTAEDGVTTTTYTVTVTRAPSTVCTLAGLSVSTGTLSPAFASGTIYYTANVPNSTVSMTVTPMVTNSTATTKVNGTTVASGAASQSIPLVVGTNTVTVLVTAQDGTTTSTYTVNVTRAPSSVATLSGIALSSGTLNPAFASDSLAYTASVSNLTTSITVTPTVTDTNATVKVNGTTVASGGASAAIPLVVGDNAIPVEVTAQDGITTKAYMVTVNRAPSSACTLSELSLSAGYFNQGFSPSIVTYWASVANTVTSINVKPTFTDPTAKVRVNGVLVTSGSLSAPIPLVVGNNTITTLVTAQNGTSVKTYTIELTRRKSRDATLSGLAVKTAIVKQKFRPTTTGYTASVPVTTKSVKIKAMAAHGAAKIKINGTIVKSGTLSAAIPLKIGRNVIKVVVTAQNGSAKTYKITVSRTAFRSVQARPDSLASATPQVLPHAPEKSTVSKVMHNGKKYLQLTIRRNPGVPKPVVEVSPNLVDWFSGGKHTTTLVDNGRILVIRDNTPITPAAKRFIRASGR